MKPCGTRSVAEWPKYQSSGSSPVSSLWTGCGGGAFEASGGVERGRRRIRDDRVGLRLALPLSTFATDCERDRETPPT